MRRTRRELLKQAALLAPLAMAGRTWATQPASLTQQEHGPRLLLVFLRGGYDALSAVVPISSNAYYHARPTIALARPDPGNPAACLPLDSNWGLHPALRDSLLPFWRSRQLAFVPFAGTTDLSRSHFETQEAIELGQPLGGTRDFGSGFMGRLAESLSGHPDEVRAIAFTAQVPLSFAGRVVVPNISPSLMAERPMLDPRTAALIEGMYHGGVGLDAAVREGFRIRNAAYRSVEEDRAGMAPGAISPRGFALTARRIGLLMRDRFNLACVDVGGWDTHVDQGAAQGELGRGLAVFADALGPQAWRRSVVVVISEFGRTFRENGDRGTDHGHGTTYWIMGGGVRGGRIAGSQAVLSPENLNEGRDLPVLNDYRSVLGGIFSRLFAMKAEDVGRIFPDYVPDAWDLLDI